MTARHRVDRWKAITPGAAARNSATAEVKMDRELQITARELEGSEALIAKIRERADKLEKLYDHIVSCHVVVESPEKRHHKGKLYNCRIHVHVPGEEIIINREPNEDPYISVRDAFDAAKRQIQEHADKRRGR
jgi:ribosomal subunit interface protein